MVASVGFRDQGSVFSIQGCGTFRCRVKGLKDCRFAEFRILSYNELRVSGFELKVLSCEFCAFQHLRLRDQDARTLCSGDAVFSSPTCGARGTISGVDPRVAVVL
jgi:hypothetical protein